MSKARDLANLISQGNPLSDGAISVSEISDLTASAAELNKLDGVTASTAELNQVVGATSALQTQLDNISVTSGSLTKTFVQNETADITLSQGITSAPVVSATKEVPQTGVSTKGNWDVNSTASNYDFHNTAANVTLTPSTVANTSISLTQVGSDLDINTYGPKPSPFFKPDGTKMYICSQSNAYIYTYSLSTAWDLSTATWDGFSNAVSTNAATSEGDPTDIFFKPDGTVLFYVGQSNDEVRAFNLSTAWDLSTASISTTNDKSVASQESAPRGLYFKPDGTRMYIVGGNGNSTFQYNLSAAWDLTSASYTSSFNSAIQDNGPHDIEFNSTGTRMYVLGGSSGNGKLFQYNLSTAWDITSASYANVFADFTGINAGTSPHGIFIDSSETRVYFGCGSSGSSRMYQFSNGTDALALGSGSFASTDVGKRIVGNGGDVVLTSTGGAFDTTGGSAFTDNSTIAAGSWQMFGLKSAGDASGITMASLSGGISDVSGFTTDTATYASGTNTNGLIDVAFKPDGTKMFLTSHTDSRTHEYNLSSAWDITTASHVRIYSYSTASYGDQLTSIAFKPDGLKMYLLNWGYDYLLEIHLSTAWDLSTASLVSAKDVTQTNFGGLPNPIGLVFKPDGSKIYMASSANSKIVEVSLTTPWNINGGNSLVSSFNVSSSVPNISPTGLEFNSDGTRFYIGNSNGVIHQYNLTTPYDLSTASYTSINKQLNTYLYGFAIKPDDSKIWATNYYDDLYQYSSGSTTVPTGQYHVGVTNNGGRIDSSAFLDINSMTAAQSAGTGTVHYAVSTDGRTTWSVAKGTDGVRPIVRNNSGTWQYNNENSTTTTNDAISTSTLTATVAFDTASYNTARNIRSFFNNDGTRLYIYGYNNEDLVSYPLSTAYDISTKGTHLQSVNLGQSPYNLVNGFGPIWNNNGTKLYYPDHTTVKELAVSTAYDLSTISSSASHTLTPSINGQLAGITWKPDGTRFYIVDDASPAMRVHTYTLTTAYDLSTAYLATTHGSVSLWSHSGNRSTSIAWADSGSQLYVLDRSNDILRRYNVSSAYDVGTATYSGTTNDIALVTGNSNDHCSITIDNNDGVLLVSDYGSHNTFQYTPATTTTTAYNTTPVWANGTVNDELYTLQQALSVTMNRMDKTQLDAVADANHFTLGNTLDLMIALRINTAAATVPTSDGVTLNYDAASLNEGAVLGTDYDFFHPSANKVQIKSLAAQNLKVRVV